MSLYMPSRLDVFIKLKHSYNKARFNKTTGFIDQFSVATKFISIDTVSFGIELCRTWYGLSRTLWNNTSWARQCVGLPALLSNYCLVKNPKSNSASHLLFHCCAQFTISHWWMNRIGFLRPRLDLVKAWPWTRPWPRPCPRGCHLAMALASSWSGDGLGLGLEHSVHPWYNLAIRNKFNTISAIILYFVFRYNSVTIAGSSPGRSAPRATLSKLFIHICLCSPTSINWYNQRKLGRCELNRHSMRHTSPLSADFAASAGVWLRATETEISASPWTIGLQEGL